MAFTKREFDVWNFSIKELQRRWDVVFSDSLHLKKEKLLPTDILYKKAMHHFLKRHLNLKIS